MKDRQNGGRESQQVLGVHKAKPYLKPVVKKLSPQEGELLPIGHACMGHQGAKELLELLDKARWGHPKFN
jgi:hypothetical protein